jgi:hypothetical protein
LNAFLAAPPFLYPIGFFIIPGITYPFFLAVLADCLNAFAVGAPFDPGFRIVSPDPALIRFRLAWILA